MVSLSFSHHGGLSSGVTLHDTEKDYTAQHRQGLYCMTQMGVTLHDAKETLNDTDGVTLHDTDRGYTAWG